MALGRNNSEAVVNMYYDLERIDGNPISTNRKIRIGCYDSHTAFLRVFDENWNPISTITRIGDEPWGYLDKKQESLGAEIVKELKSDAVTLEYNPYDWEIRAVKCDLNWGSHNLWSFHYIGTNSKPSPVKIEHNGINGSSIKDKWTYCFTVGAFTGYKGELLDFSNFGELVGSLYHIFANCIRLRKVILPNIVLGDDFTGMFYGCFSLKEVVFSKIILDDYMDYGASFMFYKCEELCKIQGDAFYNVLLPLICKIWLNCGNGGGQYNDNFRGCYNLTLNLTTITIDEEVLRSLQILESTVEDIYLECFKGVGHGIVPTQELADSLNRHSDEIMFISEETIEAYSRNCKVLGKVLYDKAIPEKVMNAWLDGNCVIGVKDENRKGQWVGHLDRLKDTKYFAIARKLCKDANIKLVEEIIDAESLRDDYGFVNYRFIDENGGFLCSDYINNFSDEDRYEIDVLCCDNKLGLWCNRSTIYFINLWKFFEINNVLRLI